MCDQSKKQAIDYAEEITLTKKLQGLNILKKNIECVKCKEKIENLVKRKRDKDGNEMLSWRCKKCQSYKSVKENSFFSLYRKPITFILTLIKYWCIQLPLVSAIDLLKLEEEKTGVTCSLPLIGSVYKNLRAICSKSMAEKKIKLGGRNKDVEIDESLVAKVSSNFTISAYRQSFVSFF